MPDPEGNEDGSVLVNWTTVEGWSYEKRCSRGKLAICAKELVVGGQYYPELLPVVEILPEENNSDASSSSKLPFSVGDVVLVDPELKREGVQPQPVSIISNIYLSICFKY